ncbi:nose resistant to fluoxetine protein 6-like [Calliphora vicina]|uniref:nose resistant to fluoxetine protein 6-like n=1 Tax=Calliphora vicina TaxID=7373 RepID=UPI00325B2AB6
MTTVRWKILFPLLALVILSSVEISRANRKNVSYYLSTNTTLLSHYSILDNTNDTLSHGQEIIVEDVDVEEEDEVDYNLISPSYETHLVKSSIIYGLAKTVNASSVNQECYRHLRNIQKGILRKEPWAMKALDASGSKPAGFVFGQNFWFGSQEACGAVRRPVGITLSENFPRVMKLGIIKEIAPFDMDYRVVYLRHNSPWQVEIKLMSEQIIHIGLCLPSSCASPEIQQLMGDYVKEGLFVENDIYDIQPEVLYMKDLKISDNFFERESFKLISVFVAFILAMILLASHLKAKANEVVTKLDNISPLEETDASSSQNIADINLSNYPQLRNFIMCFDVQENCTKIFSTKESKPSEIPVINGLRSVCALWILVFHVVWYMYFTVNNKTFLISYAEKVFFQYVSSAPVLVDVFFTVSGFLLTYNFLRNAEKMEIIRKNSFVQNTKQFFKMFFHRYLRLGPLYLVVMAVVDLLFAYISKVSVYHINERFDENCANYWWRNILFIQNLFDHKDMCLNWTWSLACEMQYFVIATILLFTYAKHPKLAKNLTIGCFIANMVWSFSIGLNINFQLSFDTFFATGTDIYISPFVRVLPYIMGAAAAWYFLEHKKREFDLSEFQEKCLWTLSFLTFFICIYSTVKRDMSYIMAISLFVVGRLLFSMSICWMIIGSATGRSTCWSRFLEAKPFQHLNRLSYAIYLLNPFVIALFFGLTSVSTHADPFMLCVLCSGFSIITYLASIVFSLAFEMPFCNWSSLILRRSSPKVKNA